MLSSLPSLVPQVLAERSLHFCVGVVSSPARGYVQGRATWSCRLLLTDCGRSAQSSPVAHSSSMSSDKYVVSQEAYTLRCSGIATVSFCTHCLREGDLIHVVSKLVQRPRYIAIHGTYFDSTDLFVTDEYGSLVRVAALA